MNKGTYTILFFSHDSGLYGAQRCLLDLIVNLPKRIRPIVVVPKPGPFVDILAEKNIAYYIFPFRRWWHDKLHLQCIIRTIVNIIVCFRLFWKFRKTKINSVYSNTLYSPVGGMFARMISAPHVWHIHEFTHLNHSGKKFDYGTKHSMSLVNTLSDIVICTSIVHKDNLSDYISLNKLRIVYNGIGQEQLPTFSDPHINRSSRDEIIMLIIGSISENKGQSDAILALSALKRKGEKVKLIIVGQGNKEYVEYLNKLSFQLHCDDLIQWEGFQNAINNYIQNADVLIVCSKFETFGRVAVEAMSLGCPVISSLSGGIQEIIEDGFNGLTYEHGNYLELADKIKLLFQNVDLHNQICRNAYASYLQKFRLKTYVDNIVNITDEINLGYKV